MMFKITITIDETRKIPVIVKPSKAETRLNPFGDKLETTLNDLGLEKVSLSELLPKYRKVKNIHQECTICQEKLKEDEYERQLKCQHTFHKKCIDRWLKKNPSCPICRHDLL